MLKKQESFINKGNRQIQEGNTLGAMHTVIGGLNHYQNKVIKALDPYPVSDAALLVMALRNFADAIEKENPNCIPLVQDLSKRMKSPDFQTTEKIHNVKQRKE